MLPSLLLVAGLVLILIAGWLWRRSRLPVGRILTSDAGARPGRLLESERHGLHGRPDYLIRRGRQIIPVEVKPSQTRVYPSAVMQLMAYCLLVEEHHGRPRHGMLVLADRSETIPYTDARRAELLALLDAMRATPSLPPRNHDHPGRCRACAFARVCSETLR